VRVEFLAKHRRRSIDNLYWLCLIL